MDNHRDQRMGCLFVPGMPLAALIRAEPGLQGLPTAVTRGDDFRSPVVACSREAIEEGVSLGMTAAQAQGLLPDLIVRPVSCAQVRSAQAALVDVARSFSPRVAIEPSGEICMDLSGLSRLFSSEEKLGSALLSGASKAGLEGLVGVASTRFVAMLAARTAEGLQVIRAGEERSFLAPLPVSLLEASADLHAALHRFGIERLGQLARLPSRGLGRRLGPSGLGLWRQARGEDSRPLVPAKWAEDFIEETEMDHPVCLVEQLLFVLQGVFQRLSERIELRGMSARALFLTLGLDPTGTDERFLHLASATGKVHTWLSVARLSLQQQPPRAAVTTVKVEAETAVRRRAQLDLFVPRGPAPSRLDDILARLAALSGEERVGSPREVDSHCPGNFSLVPFRAGNGPAGTPGLIRREWDRQLVLRAVRPPEKVRVHQIQNRPSRLISRRFQGKVMQFAGPWRLEGGWWEKNFMNRDYYEVELADGGIYRLFRDRGSQQWYVDGICG